MHESSIAAIRAKIPEVPCKEGCCDCCMPFLWAEWVAVEANEKDLAKSLACPHLVDKRCSIYDRRPIICRLFGASEDPAFQCPHGRTAENPLSEIETKEIMCQWLCSLRDEEVD